MCSHRLEVSAPERALAKHLNLFAWFLIILALGPVATHAQRGATMGHGSGRSHLVMGAPGVAMPPATGRSTHLPYQPGARGQRVRGFVPPTHSAFIISLRRASNVSLNRNFDRRLRRDRFRLVSRLGIPANGFFPLDFGYWPWWGDSYGGASDCDPYSGNCGAPQSTDAGPVESGEDAQRPMITVYLRNGSGYGALDYWVTNDVLHIATTYGAHKSFPMDEVDLVRTGKENAERGVSFTFETYPMISDPGQVLAPDSYAPACPADAAPGGSKHATAGSSEKASAFGATGTTTAKGLSLSAVRSGSPAEQAGLQAGDVLLRVDCQPILNAQDVDTAFSGAKRTVWVSYLIQGSWLTDKKIVR